MLSKLVFAILRGIFTPAFGRRVRQWPIVPDQRGQRIAPVPFVGGQIEAISKVRRWSRQGG